MHRTPSLIACVVFAAVACETGSPGQPSNFGETLNDQGPPPTYYGDVKPILDQRCVSCHVRGGIAPFALMTADEVLPLAPAITAAVTATKDGPTSAWSGLCLGRPMRMPPWLAAPNCNSYRGDPSLTPGEVATILSWAQGGALAGDASHPGAPLRSDPTGLSRVDLEIGMKKPFTPSLRPDDYRCFVFDWPETEAKFVAGFRALPGDASIVHHTIAFVAPPNQAATYASYDPDGGGYNCFGGPEPSTVRTSPLPGKNARLLGAWAPGSAGGDFAAGTGIKVEPGSKVVLQVHYSTLNAIGQDRTRVQFKLEDSVDKQAAIVPFANPFWIMPGGMPIPAGSSSVRHSFDFDLTQALSEVTQKVIPNGSFVVYGTALHMHLLGIAAKLELLKSKQDRPSCLLDIPEWNFHWQRLYELNAPVRVDPGDQLRISCHWNNSAANQPTYGGVKSTPKDVQWGEDTSDEMCLAFLYVTAL
jgi:hypothetical protein